MDYNSDYPEVRPDKEIVDACVSYSSKYHRVNADIVKAIISVEGGILGTMSRNTNGTYDMGIMQINTIHIPDLKKRYPSLDLDWKRISRSACFNIFIGSSILADRMREVDDFWTGVGNYHSKTPKYRNRYLKKVRSAYDKIIRNRGA